MGSKMNNSNFNIKDIEIGLDVPLFVIAGPCVIEDLTTCREIALRLVEIQQETGIGIIFKASFDKANRSSIDSYRGPGLDLGLDILSVVKKETGLPILTDVHKPEQAGVLGSNDWKGKVVDCLQVPAFLCRQTDLITACAITQKPINIKKGQFLSPQEVKNVLNKVYYCGNKKVMITERGTSFGYNRLVNDMTAIEEIKQFGCPVVFDATHSAQLPGIGGRRHVARVLTRAGVAAGANGLYIETHISPEESKSDASTIMPISWVMDLLLECKEIHSIVRGKK